MRLDNFVRGIVLCGCACFATAQEKQHPWDGFPELPPVRDANPDVTHVVRVEVPTKLTLTRRGGHLVAHEDMQTAQIVPLAVGSHMVLGERREWRVASGAAKADTLSMELSGLEDSAGVVNACQTEGQTIDKPTPVEEVVTVFETDIPPQHMWMPEGKKYRVLWSTTLTALR